jgi:hypothetical protein
MAKSSYAVAFLLAGWSADAGAKPPPTGFVTADEAMKHYHETFSVAGSGSCPAAGRGSDEEIVVCGRTHRQPERSPLPVSREPGEIVRHAGEAAGTGDAMAGGGCIRACIQPVKVNPVQVILAVPKVLRHILHGDD